MGKEKAEAQIMRASGAMEKSLPASWAGPSMWADVTQQTARLIVELEAQLDPGQLAIMMSIGAMAHRQCKHERSQIGSKGGVR